MATSSPFRTPVICHTTHSATPILVGVTALCITALILVIVTAVQLTIQRSEAVAMGTMFAVVVIGALGMIFILDR